jgi:RNA polymerase sigma-70 factor (ECF subfamily)
MANELNIEAIFKKYKDKVYRLALSIARNEKDAQDITQNTFLKIIKNLKYFRKESLISTWIYKIAYNEALMYLRKKKSQIRLSNYLQYSRKKEAAGLFVNWSKLPDEQLLDSEFKERVNASIRHLPIKYRIPLLLDNVERLPLKMSAKIMGLNVNSLKTRLHRAHLMIKSDITDYFRDKNIAQEKKNRKCGIWTGFVYNYAKGCLGKKQESSFRSHIKDCPSCKSFLDSYLKAVFITNGLECQDLPLELKEKIETFIFKNKQKH